MKTLTVDGVSTTQNKGQEDYTTFYLKRGGRLKKYYQYDYRHESGALLSTVRRTLKECRQERDKFIDKVNKIKGIS